MNLAHPKAEDGFGSQIWGHLGVKVWEQAPSLNRHGGPRGMLIHLNAGNLQLALQGFRHTEVQADGPRLACP